MDEQPVDAGTKMEPEVSANTCEIKTSDVYKVDKNVPSRFNNPECFRGYSNKIIHPLYQTTNQTYGSKKPTVHEMPTTFNGSRRRFSEHHLKSGMYRDNGFNAALDKSRITGPNTTTMLQDRVNFHRLYHTNGESQ
ncbi:piercer of microtubule wall 2 protein-like [Xyrauchen texanus]|uniref:piercer of microtubule wall 2 protein-like n=1 Tax=Xyrauchen texanus TaxID=154827 RepID=UPI002241C233|nr:piercer of microtubule wall 2 protein-like [Xyrauchen texanus]